MNTLSDLFDVFEDLDGWSYIDPTIIKEKFKKTCEEFDRLKPDEKSLLADAKYSELDELYHKIDTDEDIYDLWWAVPGKRRNFIFDALNKIEKMLEKQEEEIVELSSDYYEFIEDDENTENITLESKGESMDNKIVCKVKSDINIQSNLNDDLDDFHKANEHILNELNKSKSESTVLYKTERSNNNKQKDLFTTQSTIEPVTTYNTSIRQPGIYAVRNTVDKNIIREGALTRSKVFVCDKNFKEKDVLDYIGDDLRKTAIVLAKNGIFEIIRSRFGIFHIKSNTVDLPTRTLKEFKFEDEWFISKPDYELLRKLWKMNLFVMKENNGAEFYAAIIWDNNKKEYDIFVPEQTVSGAHVTFEEFIDTDDRFMVIDHHSHNTMGAFFSGTDDNNDYARFKISLVMGRISEHNFETKQRIVINTLFRNVELSEIFSNVPDNDDEEIKRIIRAKVKTDRYDDLRNTYTYPRTVDGKKLF